MFGLAFWAITIIVRVIYAVVNLDYLVTKYDSTTFSTVVFLNPLLVNFSGLDEVETIVWWE